MKKYITKLLLILPLIIGLNGCQNYDDLELNQNIPNEDQLIPPSYLLSGVLFDIYNETGASWSGKTRLNQFLVSNDAYYGGQNNYAWSTTNGNSYKILKNVTKMEEQALSIYNEPINAYSAVAKFLKAYLFVIQTQKVGDTPMSESVLGLENLTPKYDSQKDIYKQCLELLEVANTELAQLILINSAVSVIEGDIYYNNDLSKWQKLVNTFKLRVLISLSKRANDTPDLNIKQKFAEVISNPNKYPIMVGNTDNFAFIYNENVNIYPLYPQNSLNNYRNISSTYLELTTTTQDPRTFAIATPAPVQIENGKNVNDFTAYVGANISQSLSELAANETNGAYSYTNYNRYYVSNVGPEPGIIIGFSEMCLNIAEAANRGWVTADTATYYLKGINASLEFHGLIEGDNLTIGDLAGVTLGTVTVSINDFLNNSEVAYKGNNEDGLKQIITQKYISFFQNSGSEAFYNQRRTGYPVTFITTGAGLNATGKLPRRWQYPIDEQTYNTANYTEAIQSQFGGTDDLFQDIWSVK
ncbi:SusD/RagB family nutrient-binding outer membrane lipoprotein [Polaribacter sp. ALD11]|uniref:SusD/RagB family nutrient-binding outer membrane lipoprotein n=1 Tax=Polaribacter sp. ALD11 TaxID=2058137 RepID=UPI000C312CF0|nr:SusD/RagB family nutrient-binding outer membrane lipoprotein [Polaribacter sp. ALD11]AUC85493.1 SusD/RagB family nutrient-binding outer membrane lipoprotein [Polaribacter sp. ALD11]